jgi:hypothetical protein
MKKIGLAMIVVLSLFVFSCHKVTGDGPVVAETRSVSGFNGLDLRVGATVYYTQSPDIKVEVSAQQNILDVLQTYVSGNKLVVKYKDNVRVTSDELIRVNISAPDINSLQLSGSGNLYVNTPIATGSLDLEISGSGDVILTELNTAYLDANISGSGSIRISSGTTTEEKLKISGSGSLELENLGASRVTTNTSGSGTIKVTASQVLNVTISGSGHVYYKGSPQVNISASGSGRVIRL